MIGKPEDKAADVRMYEELHGRNYPKVDVIVKTDTPTHGKQWISPESLREILNARMRYNTLWLLNPETKYLNFRIDQRTGHCLIWTQQYNSADETEEPKQYWKKNPLWEEPNPPLQFEQWMRQKDPHWVTSFDAKTLQLMSEAFVAGRKSGK